jgi:sugar (pentulose or hexulose) kinase
MMLIYAVDLGTTNLKVALYDEELNRLAVATTGAVYARSGSRVEFDPEAYMRTVIDLIGECARSSGVSTSRHEAVIALSGQAESLVLLDAAGRPTRPAISWLDERSVRQAVEIAEHFDPTDAFARTGQPVVSATWPATKLRWLLEHEPETMAVTACVLLIKDYVLYRLTGKFAGELTTRGFSYLYDVQAGTYWGSMLDFCGIRAEQLPELVPAGTPFARGSAGHDLDLPPAVGYTVNVGALDHFCSMVGTGSYRPGLISESAGTVLSLSMLAEAWSFDPLRRISFHRGLSPDDIVLFNGVDSGGISLDWYRDLFGGNLNLADLDAQLSTRDQSAAPLFLPYLTGVNPPAYYADARGAFIGLGLKHDAIDLAFAVEEGVAHLLRENVEEFVGPANRQGLTIVSTGGGTASPFWNQLKADVCEVPLLVPRESESTCRGVAIVAVAAGNAGLTPDRLRAAISDFGQSSEADIYHPDGAKFRAERYAQYKSTSGLLFAGDEH